jgi:hypothetical protein
MQIGKWRRKVDMPKATACVATPADAGITRLPRNRAEGDIPQIALTTGSADPLECLLHKIGIDDSEFGVAGGPQRVHLFTGGSTSPASATSSFQAGNTPFPAASTIYNLDALKKYDVVLMSCEGGELKDTKPTDALNALYEYAKVGGRVFTSHFHHYWFSHSPVTDVSGIATWVNDYSCGPACGLTEPEPNPKDTYFANVTTKLPNGSDFVKGIAMHDWLKNTGSLTGPGDTLPIQEFRHNVNAVTDKALSWMTIANPLQGTSPPGQLAHEYISSTRR